MRSPAKRSEQRSELSPDLGLPGLLALVVGVLTLTGVGVASYLELDACRGVPTSPPSACHAEVRTPSRGSDPCVAPLRNVTELSLPGSVRCLALPGRPS